jgi:membrane protease YdiL (CAAX protease family)
VIGGLQLTAFVFIASLALTYLTFYPLSLASPDFVQWWYIDAYFPLLYYDSGVYPFLPNLLSLVSLCVVGPALEEIAFRGIILPRWTLKWGLPVGVLASSALFGVVHADPPGAFLFGVAMSVLYLKSQSLTLPILCHGLYNLAVWLMEVQYIVSNGPEHYYTLEEFQEGWPWGAGAAVIAMLWVALYMRRPKSDIRWKFPVS